jgi:hypothetical protein
MAKFLKAVNLSTSTEEYIKAENIMYDSDTDLKTKIDSLNSDESWHTDIPDVVYRKKNGWVCVRVRQTTGTPKAANDIFGTLPEGYRPSYSMLQANCYSSGGWIFIYPSSHATKPGQIEFGTGGSATAWIGCTITYPVNE